ncbi:lytic murein transglycosylase [Thermaurantiacus sp.]|uniref:lytic murein transglycosylase n=1 Tax=Thermaurantiacus sp. TaxID=2820283 RepID=UPI00298F26C8|nr:lytic murein transglycosylase [Thermaurantiacus sp.]
MLWGPLRRILAGLLALMAAPARADLQPAFTAWLTNYRAHAIAQGLDPATVDQALTGLRYDPAVVALDRSQPDDPARPPLLGDYLARRLTPARIERGRQEWRARAQDLARIEHRFGVPAPVLLGIWGMETDYGRFTGRFDVLRSLASLAFDGRRRALFTAELDAALRLLAEGRVRREDLRGSWAGATGHPQFLPSSVLAHATDGDGDGRADIWNSVPDALASIARYLVANGWQPGLVWGVRVQVPEGFDRAAVADPERPRSCVRPLERHSRLLRADDWRRRGLTPVGVAWPPDDTELSLVEPDGPGGPAFLASRNYRALLAYNCSNFYALSVGLLADAVVAAR